MPATDVNLRNRLQTLGFTVTVKTGPAVVAADATGKSVVLISESVASATVNTKLTAVSVRSSTASPT